MTAVQEGRLHFDLTGEVESTWQGTEGCRMHSLLVGESCTHGPEVAKGRQCAAGSGYLLRAPE